MADFADLIELLEKASGPDRELGRAVLLACGWHKTCVGHYLGPQYYWSSPDNKTRFDDDNFYRHNPPDSIDAALVLVPDALPAMAQRSVGNEPHCALVGRPSKLPGGPSCWRGDGATPAIALCIAALKARAALFGSKSDI